jgi:hypothetical protein
MAPGHFYAANLTPDEQTGIGLWTEKVFVKAMRTGKHLVGPADHPPMPWNFVGDMSDEELKAVFVPQVASAHQERGAAARCPGRREVTRLEGVPGGSAPPGAPLSPRPLRDALNLSGGVPAKSDFHERRASQPAYVPEAPPRAP